MCDGYYQEHHDTPAYIAKTTYLYYCKECCEREEPDLMKTLDAIKDKSTLQITNWDLAMKSESYASTSDQ